MRDFEIRLKVSEDGTAVVVGKVKALGEESEKAGRKAKESGEKAAQGYKRAEVGAKQYATAVDSAKKVSAALGLAAAASIAGVVNILGGAVQQARDFRRSMAEVSTLLGDTSAMAQHEQAVRRMAIAYGSDASQQASALYQIISAGAADAATAVATLDAANKLAIGGVTDITTAADGLTSVMNAYAAAGLTANDVSDTMFVGMRAGKTTIGELAGSLGQVAPIAATVGLEFSELVAGVSAITTAGVSTNIAVTQVRAALAAVIKPTSEAQKLAKQLGIEFDVSAVRAKGFAGFLEEVRDKTGGSEKAMATLFGSIEAIGGVLALTGTQSEKFNEILAQMEERTGETDVAFGKMSQTADHALNRLRAAVNDSMITLGDRLLNALAPAIDVLADNMEDIVDWMEIGVKVGTTYLALFVGMPAIYRGAATALAAYNAQVLSNNLAHEAAGVKSAGLVKQYGALRVAGSSLLAAFSGWEIGEQLYDQFLQVRLAGTALFVGLSKAFVSMKGHMEAGWEKIKGTTLGVIGAIRNGIADMLSMYLDVQESFDLFGLAEGVIEYGRGIVDSLRPANDAFAESAERIVAINTATDAALKDLDAFGMAAADAAIEAFATAEAAGAAAAAMAGGGEGNGNNNGALPLAEASEEAAEALAKLTAQFTKLATEGAKRATDAGRDLSRLLDEQVAVLGGPAADAALRYADALDYIAQKEIDLMNQGPLTAEEIAQLAQARANAAALHKRDMEEVAADSRRAAEESERAWDDFITDWARALSQGADGVKNMWKRMIDDLKTQLIKSGLTGLIKGLFNMGGSGSGGGFWSNLLGAFTGGGSGGGGGFWSNMLGAVMGGGGGGGGGGGVAQMGSQMFGSFAQAGTNGSGGMSLTNMGSTMFQGFGNAANTFFQSSAGSTFASVAPWALAAGGALYGFQNTGNGGLSSLAGAAAYGGLGYVGGTIALGGAMGAAAGAATGVTGAAVGGAASGAMGAAAAIPIVGWILAIAAIVDMVSGGKLFGTKFRPESATSTLSIGAEGSDAALSVREVRQRSLFRGRTWRTTEEDPGDEAREAAQALYDSIEQVMVDSARRLRGTAPEMIDAAIRTVQEFDKKGKVKATKIFVDILGRSWEEATAESAAQRIAAEAMIATIDSVLGYTSEVDTTPNYPNFPGLGNGNGGVREPGLDIGNNGISQDFAIKTVQIMGEASAIAERWRDDAETLMAGAQFLLVAASDMRAGFGLLGDGPGSLTAVTELVEELGYSGESLVDTYVRLQQATALLEQATGMMGVSLTTGREEFVRFANDIAEAAGGIDRASQLWNEYFQRFFTAEERAQYALQQATTSATNEFNDIGLDVNDFTGEGGGEAFRALFEEMMASGDMSAEAVVQFLEAAAALGVLIDATEQLAQTAGGAVNYRNEEAIRAALDGLDLEEQLAGLSEFERTIYDINQRFDEYHAALVEAGATVEELTELEEHRARAIADVQMAQAQQVNDTIEGMRWDDMLAGMSDYDAQVAQTNRQWEDAIAELMLLGASETDLAQARYFQQNALDRLAEAEEERLQRLEDQRIAQLGSLMDDVRWETFTLGATDLEVEIAKVNERFDEMIANAILLEATAEDLAEIEALRAEILANIAAREEQAAIEAQARAEEEMWREREQYLRNEEMRMRRLADLMDGIRFDDSLIGMTDYEKQIAQLNKRFDDLIQSAVDLGAASYDLREIERYRINALEQLAQQERDRLDAEISGVLDPLRWESQLRTMSDQERQQAEINRRFDEYVDTLTQAGATQEQLAELELYRQEELANLIEDRYTSEENWIQRLMDFRDSLLLDDNLSTLTPQERLAEAQRQYESVLSAAMGGDLASLENFEGTAQAFLDELRAVYGSGDQYTSGFGGVLGDIDALIAMLGGEDSGATTVQELLAALAGDPASAPSDGEPTTVATVTSGELRMLDGIDALRGAVEDGTTQIVDRLYALEAKLEDIQDNTQITAANTRRIADSASTRSN